MDIYQLKSFIKELHEEHIDQSVSIDNSNALKFYTSKLDEMYNNLKERLACNFEVDFEPAMKILEETVYGGMEFYINEYK